MRQWGKGYIRTHETDRDAQRVAEVRAGRAEASAEELRADVALGHEQRTAEGREQRKQMQKNRSKRRREEAAARAAGAAGHAPSRPGVSRAAGARAAGGVWT